MQLLLKRGQGLGVNKMASPVFHLWAKFDLDPEEDELIKKYQIANHVLVEGDNEKYLWRSIRWSAAISPLIVVGILFLTESWDYAVLGGIVAFFILTYGIFHSIRDEIIISDMLRGRSFKCRSVTSLVEKEDAITQMAFRFRQFMETLKTWGGQEVIRLEPNTPPRLELVEPARAAS